MAKKKKSAVKSSKNATPARSSAQENANRMVPGHVETDETTGQRLIHPAANPQQVNPIHDDEHEKAAVKEAAILTDPDSTHKEKIAATKASNAAETH